MSWITTLLPSYPPPPSSELDCIIFRLWDRHLELELASPYDSIQTLQHLDVTSAIIDYWEEVISEINTDEIRKRRLNSNKNS